MQKLATEVIQIAKADIAKEEQVKRLRHRMAPTGLG